MENINQTCVICGQQAANRLQLLNSMICLPCEQRLVRLEPGQAEYAELVEKMKEVWSPMERV